MIDEPTGASRNNVALFAAPSPGVLVVEDVGFVNPINTAHAVGEGESIG